MPDRPEKSNEVKAEGPGVQLRRARKKRGLLLHDIAQELHLDEWMLQALEEDDFAALGAPVFAKGHMRKYGEMLGLNSDDLMIAYYRKRGRDDSPPPVTHMMAPEPPGRRMKSPGLSWLLAILVAVIVLSIGWVVWARYKGSQVTVPASSADTNVPRTSSTPTVADAAEQQALPPVINEADDESAATDSVGLTQTELDEPVSMEPASMEVGQGTSRSVGNAVSSDPLMPVSDANDSVSPAAVVPASPTGLQVRLNLTGESWVEVTDSDGKQLVYDMMTAGRSRTVTGRPPIEVFLGNSRSVQLSVDGDDFSIPRGAVRGNTARFVIGADSR